MLSRIKYLFKLFVILLAIFVVQKIVFMLVNIGHVDGAPFSGCLSVLWHGLRLDIVTASYILIIPALVLLVSCFCKRFALRRILRPYFIIISIVVTVVFCADTVLYLYWGAKIDANDLIYAAKPQDMLASVTWWSVVLGIIAIVALCWLMVRILVRSTPEQLPSLHGSQQGRHKRQWGALVFVPLLGLLFVGIRGGVTQSTANPSYAYFSSYSFCNHAALNPTFNMIHSLFKTEDLGNQFDFMPDDEAEALMAPVFFYDDSLSDTLLATTRPDILLVIWEGAGWDMVMNDSVAPSLSSLGREGVLFSNCYANNFRTDRGLVSLLSGWQGLPTTSLMKMNDKCRKLPGLAATLRDAGYITRFVYGGDIDFTNMRGYLHETGFDDVYGKELFPDARRLSSWGAPDAYTMQPSVVLSDGDSPRFDVLLTLSSHEPWQVPMRRLADSRKNSFAYTDSCLGALVDSLRLMPQWDNLLVVIVPDHGVPLSPSQSTGDYTVSHIPMVWTGGAVKEHRTVDAMMMQSDLAATLLAQMGLDFGHFIFSRNVLSQNYHSQRHFALHAFKNGANLIDSTGVLRFDCADLSCRDVTGSSTDEKNRFLQALIQYIYKQTAKL